MSSPVSEVGLSRGVLDALLPTGKFWVPKEGGDLDKFYNGVAAVWNDTETFLANLAKIRDPKTTPYLEDLEREFGMRIPEINEEKRRARLAARKFTRRRDGSLPEMDFFLKDAGFNLNIYANDPAVDPSTLGGELIVNNLKGGDGRYTIPTDSDDWPLIVFIGGDATRGGSGEITAIADASVDFRREGELKRLITLLKTLHVWVILFATYDVIEGEDGVTEKDFGFLGTPDTRGFGDLNNPDRGGTMVST